MIKKIMIADDNKELLAGFSELMQSYGFTVCTASNAAEMETVFVTEKPQLVLLDIVFGSGEDGPVFFKEIIAAHPELKVPVVYVSGLVDSDSEKRLVRGAESAMYAKPFRIEKLVRDIHAAFSIDNAA